MKKYIVLIFLFFFKSINAQVAIPNFCELIDQFSKEKDIIISTNLINSVNQRCQDSSINEITYTEEEVYKKLNKKERKLLKMNLYSIDSNSYQIKISYYNAWKKGKKINLAIIGSSTITYCYNCDSKKFIICKEIDSFH